MEIWSRINKMGFLPESGHVSTTIWLYHLYSKSKSKMEQHKNAMCCFEQILEAASNNTGALWLPASHLTNYPRLTKHNRHCLRSKDKLIYDILWWTPTHGHTNAALPARIHIHHLHADTGCKLKNPLRAMNNRWKENQRA